MLNRLPFRGELLGLIRTAVYDPPAFPADLALARRAQRLNAQQKVAELAPLIALLRRRRIRVVLEIGTAEGGTFYVWARVAASDAVLVSVDLAVHADGALEQRLRELAGPGQQVRLVVGRSQDAETAAAVQRALNGRRIDFLMIDGDHTYDCVRADWNLYAPLVHTGGLIAFHDILPHYPDLNVGVNQLWNELKPRFDHYEFAHTGVDWGWGEWGGIGILRV
jgi:cephalosporin hydroxylase